MAKHQPAIYTGVRETWQAAKNGVGETDENQEEAMNTIRQTPSFIWVLAALMAAGCLYMIWLNPAKAQPVGQTNSILYCPTGQYDGQGNPITVPCGNAGAPVAVVVVPIAKVCPANPLTGKVPPLC